MAFTGRAGRDLPADIASGKRKVQRAVDRACLLEVPGDPGTERVQADPFLGRTDIMVSGADVLPSGGSQSLYTALADRKTGIRQLRFSSGGVLFFKLMYQQV